MIVNIAPEAEAELQDAVAYYDRESRDLGDRLEAAYFDGLDRIKAAPTVHPRIGLTTRKCKLRRFPYHLIYEVRGQIIIVVLIFDLFKSWYFLRIMSRVYYDALIFSINFLTDSNPTNSIITKTAIHNHMNGNGGVLIAIIRAVKRLFRT